MALEGSCNCGAVAVKLDKVPDRSVLCHCTSCRQSGGGIGSVNLVVDLADVALSGAPKTFTAKGDSGHDVVRHFCGACGSPVYTVATVLGDSPVWLKSGLFPPGSVPKPAAELFTRSLESWESLAAGALAKEAQ
ncbi:hypothetical protein Q5752_005401 [Cryptotrichosporon argae]